MNRFRCASGSRLRSSLRGEASNLRQLEILIAAVKFMEANWPQKQGTPGSQ